MGKGKTFRLVGLQVEEGTICDQPMNPEAKVVIFKRRPAQKEDDVSKTKTKKNAPGEGENTDPMKAMQEKLGLSDEQLEAVQQAIEEEKRKALEEEEAKRKAADDDANKQGDDDDDEANKAADPVDDEQVGKAVAKAVADLKKQLAEERNLRLDREHLEKARSFPSIPVQPEKIGGLMRAVSTLEKSHSQTLEQVLKACHELASSNTVITKSLGQANGVDSGGGGSATEEIESIAAKAMASNPDLSKADAVAKAWRDNPKLIAKARAETAPRR